jgi:glucosamine-6-phosphate deaminase
MGAAARSIATGRSYVVKERAGVRIASKIAADFWDYTTLDPEVLSDAARLTPKDLVELSRPGFTVRIFDTRESFFTAEALEYVWAWRKSTAAAPAGICGPIGPTEQLPLVAQIVNDLQIDVRHGHFWAMDEWYIEGREAPVTHPLSFAKADRDLCFNAIDGTLRMPEENLHFLRADNAAEYTSSYDAARCLIMQGGQGEVKHWAFNDPVRREGRFRDAPPTPAEYRRLSARVVDLHPMTIIQNARTSGGGVVSSVPSQALTVGPVETWKSDTVSIWHPGWHDNPFGIRLTALMISKKIPDSSVPMSLLADHPDVRFNYLRAGIGSCQAEMH